MKRHLMPDGRDRVASLRGLFPLGCLPPFFGGDDEGTWCPYGEHNGIARHTNDSRQVFPESGDFFKRYISIS
jgi:hypothetical protein